MDSNTEPHFQRTSPESQGIASQAILQFVEALESQTHEIHSFMLLRHGQVVAEGWWSPYEREVPHMLFSVSKSFTSTAVGLALAEGRFSLDDPVVSFFPDDSPAEASDMLAAMQVRHLLSMSTGHAEDTWSYMRERTDGDWIKSFFQVPVTHPPGSYFLYNTGATYILSAIVQRTTGMKLIDYLTPRLFEPLGIQNATWEESPQGISKGGIGLRLTTEEIARFGQLYLQKGRWGDQQLLPEAWVAEATAFQIANGDDPESDWAQGYGYQFWRCRHGAYRADGAFGQYCVVMPEQDAVLAMTGGVDLFDMQAPLNLVWNILLPAMGGETPTEDATSQRRLSQKLPSLALPLVEGRGASPLASQVSGRIYVMDANPFHINTICLDFTESGCTISLNTTAGSESFLCGCGQWQYGQAAALNTPDVDGQTAIAANGAWTADDCFTMVVRLYETPFYYTLNYHFADNELMVEARVNVSFEALETRLLTGSTP